MNTSQFKLFSLLVFAADLIKTSNEPDLRGELLALSAEESFLLPGFQAVWSEATK